MNIVILVLQIVAALLALAVLALCIFLLLPAGILASWKAQKAEIWLSIGPLKRRFYPPREREDEEKTPQPSAKRTERKQAARPLEDEPAAEQTAPPEPREDTQKSPHREPHPDEVDRLYDNLMDNPMKYVRMLTHWAKGPGKLLLDHLKVKKVRIVWTVTGEDAAQTAIAYGALAAACNTAWAAVEDLVDIQAEELRLEPDFTGERRKERCFSCQITARMYIIMASVILTVWRRAKRRTPPAKRRKAAASAKAE